MTIKVLAQRIQLPFCVALVALMLLPPTVWPQSGGASESFIVFPRFVSYQYDSSGIAVFNPTGWEATVELTLRWWDGVPVDTVINPVTITVPARGQVAKTAGELFGTGAYFDASLEIRSATPGLVAYYQAFDSELSYIDGADAPEASTGLVFPVVPGPSEGISEIDFRNPNPRSTSVELNLWSFDGELLGKANIQVPANGIYRNLADSVFPAGTSFAGASHITTISRPVNLFSQAQPVMGTSLFAGFSSHILPGGAYDVAAVNALPITHGGTAGAFPYFRVGAAHASAVAIANLESSAIEVTLTAVGNNGAALANRKLSLKANGGVRAALQAVIPALAGEKEGWLLVQSTGRIAGALIYGRSDGASLTAVPLQRTPKTEFAFPQIVQTAGTSTELTLANPSPNTSQADVYVVAPNGKTLAYNRVAIGPSKRVSVAINQIVPEITAQSGGTVYVASDEPLFSSTSISTGSALSSSFVPQAPAYTFYPAPQESFAITGRVTLNDLPAPGFTIILSGPEGGLATSDESGFYAFKDLPPGKYSMTVDQHGFQFIPSQTHFEIAAASIRQDFRGYTAANAIVVQPASIEVGGDDTTLHIYGRDFNSSSEAFAGLVRLKTTWIDPTHVEAVLPEYILETPTLLDVVVITNPNGVDRRATQPYGIVVYQDRPELDALTTEGVIMEGSAGATIRLRGDGFLKDAKVLVNGRSDGIQINFLDEAHIVAYVPAQYLSQGGIYPVTVSNPYPANAESNVQLLTVYYPAPAVEGILPSSLPAKLELNSASLDLEVRGYGFRRGATVMFNGKPLSTTYCGDPFCAAVRLYAKVPPEYLRESGFATISVVNPTPSIGSSENAYLRIEGLQPTITAVQPGSATALALPFEFSMPILVQGTNFGPQTMIRVYKAGATQPEFSTDAEVLSSTQLTYFMDIVYPGSLGEWRVEVANPPPGGGLSEPVSFLITEGSFTSNPFLISLNPQYVAAGGPSFTLTANGTNLKPGAVVFFYYTPLVTTVVSDRQIRAEVPASLIQAAGRIPISVTNPDNGGTSNRLFLEIR